MVAIWLLGCSLAMEPEVLAQSQGQAIPLSGRSTLVGGTGVALGRDGAAPFLNPATMGRIADHRLAFSTHFYRYSTMTIDQLIHVPSPLGSGPFDASHQSFSGLPSSFCAFFTLAGLIPEEARGAWQVVRGSSGRTKLGICGATIEREQWALSAYSRTVQGSNREARLVYHVGRDWQRQSVGPSLSYQLTENLALGASLHVVTTTANHDWDIASLVDEANAQSYQQHLQGSSLDGATTVGATWSHASLSFGASLRLPSVGFSDSARMTHFTSDAESPAVLTSGAGSLLVPLPPILTIGTGYETKGWSAEFDMATSLHTDAHWNVTLLEKGASSEPARAVNSQTEMRPAVAFRAGGEWFFTPSLSVLAGARYEPGRVKESARDAAYRLGPFDRERVAMSAGLGSYGEGIELLIGGELSHGWGKLPIVGSLEDGERYVLADYRATSWLLVLSGSIGLSSVRQTFRNFRAIRPRPQSPDGSSKHR